LTYYGGGGFSMSVEGLSPVKREWMLKKLESSKAQELKARKAAAKEAKA
jgi:hypothetical protein